MKVTCPKNAAHDRFVATAHVTEDWIVNAEGDFEEVAPNSDVTIVHAPDKADLFECADCGSKANVA